MCENFESRLQEQIQGLQGIITLADQKSVFVLAASTLLLSRDAIGQFTIDLISFSLGVLTVLFSILVIFPRTESSVGETSWDELSDLNSESANKIFKEEFISRQILKINSLSKISQTKHNYVRISLTLLSLHLLSIIIGFW